MAGLPGNNIRLVPPWKEINRYPLHDLYEPVIMGSTGDLSPEAISVLPLMIKITQKQSSSHRGLQAISVLRQSQSFPLEVYRQSQS